MGEEVLYNAIIGWFDDSIREWKSIDDEEWIGYVCKKTGLTREEYVELMLEKGEKL